jgi:hypothetical protein
MQQKGDEVVPTNDDRQRAIEEEVAASGKLSKPKRGHLDVAIIVMLSVVTLMIIALLFDLLTTPGLLRG